MSEVIHYCKSCGRPVPTVPPLEPNYKRCDDCIFDIDHAIAEVEQKKPIHKILFGVVDFGIHERVNYVRQSDNKFVTIIRMNK